MPENYFIFCEIEGNGIKFPCGFNPVAGTKDLLLILDYERVASYTRSALNKNVVTAITRLFGGEASLFTGKNNSIKANSNAEQGTYIPINTQDVSFIAFGDNPEIKRVIDSFSGSKVVAILLNANGWWEIYGANDGLTASSTRSTDDADTGGGYVVTLTGNKEIAQPLTFALNYDNTDVSKPTYNEATTKALILGLANPITLSVSGISAGVNPVLTLASTAELYDGMRIRVRNITWTTPPTTAGNLLNEGDFVIRILTATTIQIVSAVDGVTTFNTTGGVYGSGGTIQKTR